MNFAVLTGTLVTNVVVCETKELAEEIIGQPCVELIAGAGIGWIYDQDKGTFTAPKSE